MSFSLQNATLDGVKEIITKNDFVIFSLSHCPFCVKVKEFFKTKSLSPLSVEIDQTSFNSQFRKSLFELTSQRTFPNVFAYSNHLGGCDDVLYLEKMGIFDKTIQTYHKRLVLERSDQVFDYDVVVIGGGSGGLACAKEFSDNGKKVALFDYVVPSPQGTKWGLGGTCVNVGCIPKKLMHQAALHRENFIESEYYGWNLKDFPLHNWDLMTKNINNYIKKLNFTYRADLSKRGVNYINALAKIKSKHEINYLDEASVETSIKAKYIVLATGERPSYLDIPGKEHVISSDDLFWLKYPPGKTLVVGASYVALECAGALHGMGFDVTVLVRSIFLRGYDQQMAEKIGEILAAKRIKIHRPAEPLQIECLKKIDHEKKLPGLLKVTFANTKTSEKITEEFNTVLVAIGRESCTKNIGLETVGIPLDQRNRVISVDNREQTICENVFALGDILAGKPQLTPVAIKAGQLLAKRLCNKSYENCNYSIVPTTVFTPVEYGAIGLSEEEAIKQFGEEDVDVFHNECAPLETKLNYEIPSDWFYAKLITRISQNNKIIGFHILSPNAGEITQGYAVAMHMGATLSDFSKTFGIHPTVSETFTSMKLSKKDSAKVVGGEGC